MQDTFYRQWKQGMGGGVYFSTGKQWTQIRVRESFSLGQIVQPLKIISFTMNPIHNNNITRKKKRKFEKF